MERIQDIVPSLSEMEPLYGSWLVESIIPQGSLVMISGPPGGGKSTLALALGGSISSGRSFAGFKTSQAPVLYLDRENPQIIAQGKVNLQGWETDESFIYWGNWVTFNNIKFDPPGLNHELVLKYVNELTIKPLIILDSMTAFYKGDENDSVKIRLFLNQARNLADAGATVLLIHHSGKAESAQEYRGSSDIPASLDVGFVAKKVNKGQLLEEMVLKPFKTRFLTIDSTIFGYEDGVFEVKKMSFEEEMIKKMKGSKIHADKQSSFLQASSRDRD